MGKHSSALERVTILTLSLIFLAATLFLTKVTWSELTSAWLAPQFAAEIPVNVIQSEVLPSPTQKGGFVLAIDYEYGFEGKRYRSRQIWPDTLFGHPTYESRESATLKLRSLLRPGLFAYVNRLHPERAFLEKLSLAPVLFLLPLNLVLLLTAPMVLYILFHRLPSRKSVTKAKGRSTLANRSTPYWAHMPSLSAVALLSFGFALATGWMLYRSLYLPYQRTQGALKFQRAECVLESVEMHPVADSTGEQQIFVEYRYHFQGKLWEGYRYDFLNGVFPAAHATILRNALQSKLDRRVECFVDPKDPRSAVIERRYRPPKWREIIVLTGAFATSVVFFLNFLTLLLKELLRRRRTRFDVINVAEDTRRQVDSITTRRRMKAVFGICLSLFLSAFTFFWAGDFFRNFSDSLSPLVTLVGLPLLGLTAYAYIKTWEALRHLSAPTPKLFFPKRTVSPGGELEFRWEIDLGVGKNQIKALQFELRAFEVAVSGEGEDVDTYRSQFYSKVESVNSDQFEKGSLTFKVPERAALSFHGRYNHVNWEVALKIETVDEERVSESFDISILPQEVIRART